MSIDITRDGPVAIIAINRPTRRNAVDLEAARDLFDAFRAFDADEASVAVLTGAAARSARARTSKRAAKAAAGGAGRGEQLGPMVGAPAPQQTVIAAVEPRRSGGANSPSGATCASWPKPRHSASSAPFRRAARGSRHRPPAAPDRPLPGDGPHPHQPSRRRPRSAAISLGNRVSRRAKRSRMRSPGQADRRVSANLHASTASRRSNNGTSMKARRSITKSPTAWHARSGGRPQAHSAFGNENRHGQFS